MTAQTDMPANVSAIQFARMCARFATAPAWYRPVLAARNDLAARLATVRSAPPAVGGGEEQHLVRSDVSGRLIPERVVPGPDVDAARLAHHVARYVWALPRVASRRVVDLGCGTGYGTYLLSWAAAAVTGVDVSEEALRFARSHYPGVSYERADLGELAAFPAGEVSVCFEVLEHLSDPEALLAGALAAYPRALFSFPNPIWHNSELNPHHLQDWPLSACRARFRAAGATSVRLFSQSARTGTISSGYRPLASVWLFDVATA
jgi:SAM-dependent methyltransferase